MGCAGKIQNGPAHLVTSGSKDPLKKPPRIGRVQGAGSRPREELSVAAAEAGHPEGTEHPENLSLRWATNAVSTSQILHGASFHLTMIGYLAEIQI